jgi:hypothetical protein
MRGSLPPKRAQNQGRHSTKHSLILSFHPPVAAKVTHTHHAVESSTPRTPAPERPPPPIETPHPDPGEEYHTPTPSFEVSPPEEYGSANDDGTANAKSPQLPPLHFPSGSPVDNNAQDGRAAAVHARPQLRLATGVVRTPSQGSTAAKSPSPSPSPLTPAPAATFPSPSPPSPLTPEPAAKSPSPSPPSLLTPAPAPAVNNNKTGNSTPKRAEAWKPLPPPLASPGFDPAVEAVTSPLRVGKPRLDDRRRTPALAENGGTAAAGVSPDVAAVREVAERRSLSVALRLATAVLSLAAFSVMVTARTTGWAGDYYARHDQYRYFFVSGHGQFLTVLGAVYGLSNCHFYKRKNEMISYHGFHTKLSISEKILIKDSIHDIWGPLVSLTVTFTIV